MKAGYKTTEFAFTAIKLLLALAVTCGWIHPGDADTLAGQIVNAVTAMSALLASGYAVAHYSQSRAKVKETQAFQQAHASRK